MQIEIYEVTCLPGDVLRVRGAVDGVAVRADGWITALTHHYSPASYKRDEHGVMTRAVSAVVRAMTDEEAHAYCAGLLADEASRDRITVAVPDLPAIKLDPEPDPEPEPEPEPATSPVAALNEGDTAE